MNHIKYILHVFFSFKKTYLSNCKHNTIYKCYNAIPQEALVSVRVLS